MKKWPNMPTSWANDQNSMYIRSLLQILRHHTNVLWPVQCNSHVHWERETLHSCNTNSLCMTDLHMGNSHKRHTKNMRIRFCTYFTYSNILWYFFSSSKAFFSPMPLNDCTKSNNDSSIKGVLLFFCANWFGWFSKYAWKKKSKYFSLLPPWFRNILINHRTMTLVTFEIK